MARVSAIGSEYVNLVLTRREAEAIHEAVSEGLVRDSFEPIFAVGRDRAAAWRAYRALTRVLATS